MGWVEEVERGGMGGTGCDGWVELGWVGWVGMGGTGCNGWGELEWMG